MIKLKDLIKEDVEFFLKSEKWYEDRDVPYTRGYLFYGHPGTGKTSMIKALSLHCKRHIHFLILSNVESDAQLLDLLSKINYKETVLVIEDIDCIFEDRKIGDGENMVTLQGLLNCLDGFTTVEGTILCFIARFTYFSIATSPRFV